MTNDFKPDVAFSGLFDTHAHLSFLDERGIDGEKCVSTLFDSGFAGIIDIGTIAGDLAGRVKVFSRFDKVHFAAGIWPHKEAIARHEAEIALLERDIAAAPAGLVVAIGECGFDRRENPDSPPAERGILEAQLDLAQRKRLPVIIHSREAPAETVETLAAYPGTSGIIHCFSYTAREARIFLDMGFYISFAGNLTFKNAQNLREALQIVPLDRLLLETDSPYLAPAPYRGKAAHPGMIAETYRHAADLLKVDIEVLKENIRRNAALLFALP
ncbi:MAG: TatD family hydrolase [Spirochaetaceae bacterium]|jgi:TatD DNase family protein|nr:TatD family hydrolase [Spirochaetaceae bacterium]